MLDKLEAHDFRALIGSLDWILKLVGLERALSQRPQLEWNSPQIKHIDHLYSNLDPAEGLFWLHDRAGVVQHIVTSGDIERFLHEPPADTRAWTRAMLLRAAGNTAVNYVDWDRITFKLAGSHGFATYQTLWMPDPRRMTKRETEHLFRGDRALEDIVAALQDLAASQDHAEAPEVAG